jgi:hypothetical protein
MPGVDCLPHVSVFFPGGTLLRLVPIDEVLFRRMLERVCELRDLADHAHSRARVNAHVRARLNWSRQAPVLLPRQSELADEVVELLQKPRLSSYQSRELQRAFFGK